MLFMILYMKCAKMKHVTEKVLKVCITDISKNNKENLRLYKTGENSFNGFSPVFISVKVENFPPPYEYMLTFGKRIRI